MSTSKRKKPLTLPLEDPILQASGTFRTPKETRNSPRNSTKTIHILVVEDQIVVREGLVAILSFQADLLVVGEAEDGIQAEEIAIKTKPDVILLDLVMPRQDGLITIPKLKELVPESKILVLTSFADNHRVYESIKCGALGYILKDTPRTQLLQAIRDAAKGQATIHPSIAIEVIYDFKHPAKSLHSEFPLTPRELNILRLIAQGLSNEEIAKTLALREPTVAKYINNILKKTHLSNRTQAALYAIRERITDP